MMNEFAKESIGYCHPPKQHRFKKGQSGNPRGRPRGRKSFMTILDQALNEPVSVQEGGKRKRMKKVEAGAKQFANRVASGDPQALKLLIGFEDCLEWAENDRPHPHYDMREEILREAEQTRAKLEASEAILRHPNASSGHVPPR